MSAFHWESMRQQSRYPASDVNRESKCIPISVRWSILSHYVCIGRRRPILALTLLVSTSSQLDVMSSRQKQWCSCMMFHENHHNWIFRPVMFHETWCKKLKRGIPAAHSSPGRISAGVIFLIFPSYDEEGEAGFWLLASGNSGRSSSSIIFVLPLWWASYPFRSWTRMISNA